ncbi:MAG: LysR family transcriptional regulator [Gammaproteobacteria bacterium]|nr:LysR family transcriptional regulator [Gammaproteobacteria bacterium]
MQEQQLSVAAERLCMSQPAVSNALKRLRISFRDDLFVRTRRGLKPTQRAVELHEAIAPVLESPAIRSTIKPLVQKSQIGRWISPWILQRSMFSLLMC